MPGYVEMSGAGNTIHSAGAGVVGHIMSGIGYALSWPGIIKGMAITTLNYFAPRVEAAIIPQGSGLAGQAIGFGVRSLNNALQVGLIEAK